MLFYLKRSFAALTLSNFLPLYKTFIRPHLEYAIQATHPILCRDAEALGKVQKLALTFAKGLRHNPYEAALKQFRLFSLTHRRIRGDLIAMFKITHGLLEFPMASTFVYPTRQGLRGHTFKFHQQRCCSRRRQFAFTIRAVPFWRDSQRIVGEIFQGTPGCPLAVPVHDGPTRLTHLLPQPIPSAHIDPRKNSHLMTLLIYPHHPLVVNNSLYCSVDQ